VRAVTAGGTRAVFAAPPRDDTARTGPVASVTPQCRVRHQAMLLRAKMANLAPESGDPARGSIPRPVLAGPTPLSGLETARSGTAVEAW